MNPLLLIAVGVVAIIAVLIVAILLKAKLRGASAPIHADADYELLPALLTPAERSFAGVLDGALPDGVAWFAKVRLGDVFRPRHGLSPSARATASNRIDRKHVDFLLVRSSDLAPIAGVELDDRSHETTRRRQRDVFVDEVFRSCNLPLLHVPAKAAYSQGELREQVSDLLRPAVLSGESRLSS